MCVLALAVGAGTARASTTIDPSFFGQHLENYPSYPDICGASGSSCPAPPWGVSAIRLWDSGVSWCDIEPTSSQDNWTQLDNWLNTYPNANFVYTFGKPPGWAEGTTGGCQTSSNAVVPSETAWKNFVTRLVQHAAGRIKYFELWNEWDGAWGGTTAQMVAFAHDAAQIIHGANQGLQVLTPSVSDFDGRFYGTCTGNCLPNGTLENFLSADPASTGDIDIVDVHTYPMNSNNEGGFPEGYLPQWIAHVRSAMATYGGYANYPLWSTEGSWGNNANTFPGYSDSTGASQRAFVARYYLQMLSNGVGRAYWYAYANPSWGTLWPASPAPGGWSATNALVNPTTGWLTGATITTPCSKDGTTGVWTCNLTRSSPAGYQGQILWTESTTPVCVPIPSGYTTLRTLSGGSSQVTQQSPNGCPSPSTQLQVSTEPILIEN